jgi:hypothetical protein
MEFDLTHTWQMLPERVIARDECTQSQQQVLDRRSERHLSMQTIENRRQRLAERFNCQSPSVAFFEEIRVDDATLIGPEAISTRSKLFRQQVAAEFAQLQLLGEQLTFWPVDHRWPLKTEIDLQLVKRRNAIMKRLDTRYWRRQCRSTKGLAKYLLKQCYRVSDERICLGQQTSPRTGVLLEE